MPRRRKTTDANVPATVKPATIPDALADVESRLRGKSKALADVMTATRHDAWVNLQQRLYVLVEMIEDRDAKPIDRMAAIALLHKIASPPEAPIKIENNTTAQAAAAVLPPIDVEATRSRLIDHLEKCKGAPADADADSPQDD